MGMRPVSAEAAACQINRLCDYCHQMKNFVLHFKGRTNQTFKKFFYFWRKLSIFRYTKPLELFCDGPNCTMGSFLLTGVCRCQPAYSIICARIENVNVSKRLELSACLNTDSYRQVFKAVQLSHINGHHLKTALPIRAHQHVGCWDISEIQHQAAQGESVSDRHLVVCHQRVCYKKSFCFFALLKPNSRKEVNVGTNQSVHIVSKYGQEW